MTTDYDSYSRGRITRELARLAIKAHRARKRETLTPTRAEPLEDSYIYTRNWLGFLRKRPTLNTLVRRVMEKRQ